MKTAFDGPRAGAGVGSRLKLPAVKLSIIFRLDHISIGTDGHLNSYHPPHSGSQVIAPHSLITPMIREWATHSTIIHICQHVGTMLPVHFLPSRYSIHWLLPLTGPHHYMFITILDSNTWKWNDILFTTHREMEKDGAAWQWRVSSSTRWRRSQSCHTFFRPCNLFYAWSITPQKPPSLTVSHPCIRNII